MSLQYSRILLSILAVFNNTVVLGISNHYLISRYSSPLHIFFCELFQMFKPKLKEKTFIDLRHYHVDAQHGVVLSILIFFLSNHTRVELFAIRLNCSFCD